MNIMLEKSAEYFQAAHLVFDNTLYNVTVSNAYYACFHLAIVALDFYRNEDYPIEDTRKRSHKCIIGAFERYLIKEDKRLSAELKGYLKELEHHRMIADYEPNYSISREEAMVLLEKAGYFFEVVEHSITHSG